MKTWAALTLLLVLGSVPTRADEKDRAATLRGEIEFLELEQDVDRTLLREAMLRTGRARLRDTDSREATDDARKKAQAEIKYLEMFIREKQDVLINRVRELKNKTSELAALEKPVAIPRVSPPNRGARAGQTQTPGDDKERQELIGKLEEAQIEVQLLQIQTQLYQQPLNEAVQSLANAEFAAADDKTQQEKADAARKRFEKAREQYVSFSKKLQLEQGKLNGLQMRLGIGGMGGGFR